VIYFSRRVPANIERALDARYVVRDQSVNGRHYSALIPRAVAAPASP